MKLLFLENRYKTHFFEEVVKDLIEKHDIFWIVQNPQFTPKIGETNIIPFPNAKSNYSPKDSVNIEYDKIIKSDRQVNFFEKKDKSFFYYYADQIDKCISEIRPDFVFGESTAFHELLAIEVCKQRNITYLNPSSCRYPSGRFSFYKYDTLAPYLGSEDVLPKDEALSIIDGIVNKKSVPDYMKRVSMSKTKILKDKAKKITSFISGEKYNTPNPLVKYKIEKSKKQNIDTWESSAISGVKKNNTFKVLYPLQMQPEANIDVWGRKWRNQSDLIRKIIDYLPENCDLYVKPNPKSKYELSDELVDICQKGQRIIQLGHAVKMQDVFNQVDMIITVTGTIAIESILANKPVITLIRTLNNDSDNCLFLNEISELTDIVAMVKENEFPKSSIDERLDFINMLNQKSFKGIVSDPFSDPKCLEKSNIQNIVKAFNLIFQNQEPQKY
ncbi:hypothetical protein [uncultured Aquimarina sp.]|uniref:capsular polysaccharide export protein, LipB/KpsS family n=1 Tax=uncultured Aquimarina sp. TaxID=575652 RepID=UPI0026050A62|nr:hypothetical protein [uncultured Aquimarina sp.]